MIQIPVANSFPAACPSPSLEFSGMSRNATIETQSEPLISARRSRYTKGYETVTLGWVLTLPEFDIFEEWFEEDLGNGAAAFTIELRHPKSSELTGWIARFLGGYESSAGDGHWTVSAEVILLGRSEVEEET